MSFSSLHPHCEVRPVFGNQLGVYTRTSLQKGEVIAIFAGLLATETDLTQVPEELSHLVLQIEEDTFLVPNEPGLAHRFNHSCEPNCGFSGQVVVVTLRDLPAGEHLTFDYAMCDGTPYDEFDCQCGSHLCRHKITGED